MDETRRHSEGATTGWAGPLWSLASSLVGEGCQSFSRRQQLNKALPSEAHGPLPPFQPLGDSHVAINQWHHHHLPKDLTMSPSGLVRAWLCLTLCDPVDCSSPAHGDTPGKNTGVRSHSLLQTIFPTQGSNPGLPHCRRILNQLGHQGSRGGEPQGRCLSAVIWLP